MVDSWGSLDAEHRRLQEEQADLLREHGYLEQHPEDSDGHRAHSRKLRAHIDALHAHLNAIQTQLRTPPPRKDR